MSMESEPYDEMVEAAEDERGIEIESVPGEDLHNWPPAYAEDEGVYDHDNARYDDDDRCYATTCEHEDDESCDCDHCDCSECTWFRCADGNIEYMMADYCSAQGFTY